jgi:hypothetical protein
MTTFNHAVSEVSEELTQRDFGAAKPHGSEARREAKKRRKKTGKEFVRDRKKVIKTNL